MLPRRERGAGDRRSGRPTWWWSRTPSAVTWLTGFAPDIETGPNVFGLSAIAVLEADGTPVLVVSEDEAEAAAATGCSVATYPGYSIGPIDPVAAAARALSDALADSRVAIERDRFPPRWRRISIGSMSAGPSRRHVPSRTRTRSS